MSGPLAGIRVLELANLAPVPFACTVLSDLGAEVLRVDRADAAEQPGTDPLARGRRVAAVDLKHPQGREAVLKLVAGADVLVEGFRPGVCERLGVGPADCQARNPRLIYARLTGWGQDGPLAASAGHDIDYLAVAGALWPIGPADRPPPPPLNYLGDFGGGGLLTVVGVLSALVERAQSGEGQVVDAAMVDGAALLSTALYGYRASGLWQDRRDGNPLDGAAPFYRCYTCADGGYVAVGAIEPQFYAALLHGLQLDPAELPDQYDPTRWPVLTERLAEVFASKTRDEWVAVFDGTDACVAPVLPPAEAAGHPHNAARGTFVDVAGVVQPGAAPRFSRTPGEVQGPPAGPHTAEALTAWGVHGRRGHRPARGRRHPLMRQTGRMPRLTIEPATDEDLPVYLRIRDAAAEDMVANGIVQWRPGELTVPMLLDWLGDGRIYAARLDGELVGGLMLMWADPMCGANATATPATPTAC
ncbi:MAG: CoA transferase [Streptosporangiales bacterium]|nr:CoA transferase [Streptosporangiales bacterium]